MIHNDKLVTAATALNERKPTIELISNDFECNSYFTEDIIVKFLYVQRIKLRKVGGSGIMHSFFHILLKYYTYIMHHTVSFENT